MKINTKNENKKISSKITLMTNQILKHISIILEDSTRIDVYFKKNFPFSYNYLPYIKLSVLMLLILSLKNDSNIYMALTSNIVTKESSKTAFHYSKYLALGYFFLILYDYILSIYIIYKANSPVRNTIYQVAKHTAITKLPKHQY